MTMLAIWATMQARPGRETEARSFLEEAHRRIARDEPGTTSFHALDLGNGSFAIFNTFVDEEAVMAHVNGPIAAWVQATNPDLFVEPYAITRAKLFAHKPHTTPTAVSED
ncbi:antibiotic biosynthesis monooxygenase [Sphingobium sp. SCG-1]|uniref:putative quinol monooxygenase n=1 Tax=Sphingobium sp. SCG-1 TaxID=2072936 RepID=UPI000CD6AD0C|nr:antibiotic biosynthesis monooxygenase [Sphingobium sp. SCG-1]AUW58898.1 antibiotic biosynthesis monooxygenase [Sphingobium sp. SCG-1]